MKAAGEAVVLTGPVLVFGGPYGNLEATQAVFAEARRRGIAPKNIVCTGDLAAYCADPQPVIDLVRRAGIRVVMGNCEESLAAGAADCGCGFAEDSACAALASEWYAYADRRVDSDSRRWMGSLPRRLNIVIGPRLLAMVHGGVTSINRFVFASTDDAIAEELAASGCDGVIAGHCGLPFTCERNGWLWHNAGVIGMPANDGTSCVWYSILAPTDANITIAHHALAYDHRAAAARMRASGLSEDYASALETGLWPSCDILPAAELAARGVALEPGTVLWRGPGQSLQGEVCWPRGAAAKGLLHGDAEIGVTGAG